MIKQKNFQPAIKWSGSKRSSAKAIVSHFPKQIDTYYEPFCGGCSVMRALMEDDAITVNNFVISDNNKELIELWELIVSNPQLIITHYERLWNELNIDDDRARKRDFYEMIRERFNRERNPLDFFFIMRTTTNGMPRYNSSGDFNNSFHITRNGINPETMRGILFEWSELLNKHNVEFKCCDYTEIVAKEHDFMYLDPPYANSKGMYSNGVKSNDLFNYIRNLKCKYALSYDGVSGNDNKTYIVPKDIFKQHLYIKSGNSSFKRIKEVSKDSIVYESLYVN